MVGMKKQSHLQKDQKAMASKFVPVLLGESAYTDVPSEPQGLIAAFTTARFITLKWREPEQSSSPVLAYSVFYKLKDSDRYVSYGIHDLNPNFVNNLPINTQIENKVLYLLKSRLNKILILRERVANTSRADISISGLTPSRTYEFKVAAINSQGIGKPCEPIEASTLAEAHVPGIPKALKVYATSSSSIAAEWQAPDNGEAPVSYYKMFYMKGDTPVEHHVVTFNNSYEVQDLQKYSEYSVWVVAFSPSHEPGASTEQVIARTLGDIPDEAPSNVTLEAASSTVSLMIFYLNSLLTYHKLQIMISCFFQSIVVRWEPPPEHAQNGLINGYKIRFKRKGKNKGGETISTAGNRRMHVITDLDRDAEYQIRMWALNANGTGPPTDWMTASTLDNDLDESRVPDPPTNLRVRPAVDSVHVTWTPASGKNVMVRGYTIGWGPGIPDVFSQVVEGKERYYHIQNLSISNKLFILHENINFFSFRTQF
jgi:neogenin